MGKFLDKSQLPLNRTTNATGLLSAIGAITGAIDGITGDRPVMTWLPVVMMGFAGAIAQWLQGVPTQKTQLIGDILQLNGSKTNAEFIRGVMARIIAAGVVPGLGTAVDRGDVGGPRSPQRRGDAALNAELLDGLAASSNYVDRGSLPAPAARVARYWEERPPELPVVGSPTIDGTNMSGVEFAVRSASGSDGPDGPRSEAW